MRSLGWDCHELIISLTKETPQTLLSLPSLSQQEGEATARRWLSASRRIFCKQASARTWPCWHHDLRYTISKTEKIHFCYLNLLVHVILLWQLEQTQTAWTQLKRGGEYNFQYLMISLWFIQPIIWISKIHKYLENLLASWFVIVTIFLDCKT